MRIFLNEAFIVETKYPTTLKPQTREAILLLNFLLGLGVGNLSINYGLDNIENRANGLIFETKLEAKVAQFFLNALFSEV